MDKELIAYLDERFRESAQQVSQLRDLVEGLRDDVQRLADGVIGISGRHSAAQAEVARRFDDLEHKVSPLYIDLNRRITFLEGWAERKDQDPIELIRRKFGKPRES